MIHGFRIPRNLHPFQDGQGFSFGLASRFIILAFRFKHTAPFELNVISIYFYRVNINVKGALEENREDVFEATREACRVNGVNCFRSQV